MKNSIVLIILALLTTAFTAHANPIENENLFRTIILINGTPFLVELNGEGKVLQRFTMVPDYFETPETHDYIVSRVSETYDDELALLANSRLIIFQEEKALLDETAVNHIREFARLYSNGRVLNINITAGHQDDFQDEALAAHRIEAVFQLLKDFGVEEGDISADMKIYKSDLPNQFVKIDFLK
jgi:hypothetical protein